MKYEATIIEKKLLAYLHKKHSGAAEELKQLKKDGNLFTQLIESNLLSAEAIYDFLESQFFGCFVCPQCGRQKLTGIVDGATLECPKCNIAMISDTSGNFENMVITGIDDPIIGCEIAQYRVRKFAGGGARGAVYEAVHKSLQRKVALKILKPNFVRANLTYVERFHEEARALARLAHPNIIQIHDAGKDRGLYFMAMEFIPSGSLKDKLKRLGQLWEDEALVIIQQVADALVTAHEKGLIHLDIKPGNIMIEKDGKAKLTDFGLVRQMALKGAEPGELIRGTPAYISPEQARRETLDERSDIYSLGITLFRMLSGVLPYVGSAHDIIRQHSATHHIKRLRTFMPEISREADAIVWKMVRKSPAERYQSARELKEDLTRTLKKQAPMALVEREQQKALRTSVAPATPKTVIKRKAKTEARPVSAAFFIGLGILGVTLAVIAYILIKVLNSRP